MEVPPGLQPILRPGTRVNQLRNRYVAEDAEFRFELESAGFSIADAWCPEENVAIYVAKPAEELA